MDQAQDNKVKKSCKYCISYKDGRCPANKENGNIDYMCDHFDIHDGFTSLPENDFDIYRISISLGRLYYYAAYGSRLAKVIKKDGSLKATYNMKTLPSKLVNDPGCTIYFYKKDIKKALLLVLEYCKRSLPMHIEQSRRYRDIVVSSEDIVNILSNKDGLEQIEKIKANSTSYSQETSNG